MNSLSLAVLVALAAMATTASSLKKPYYDLKDAEKLFEKFIKDYNRHYKDDADKKVHFEAFKKTLAEINELNASEPHAVFDINDFADNTEEEKKQHLGFIKKPGMLYIKPVKKE